MPSSSLVEIEVGVEVGIWGAGVWGWELEVGS